MYRISPTKTVKNSSNEIRTQNIVINRNVYEHEKILMRKQRRHRRDIKTDIDNPVSPAMEAKRKKQYEVIFENSERNSSRKIFDKIRQQQKSIQRVSILIHNLTVLSDGEEKDSIVPIEVNSLGDEKHNFTNQTEILYSVYVGGKPVLASTAAEDMRLISEDEAVKIMENMVFLKAERKFLKIN